MIAAIPRGPEPSRGFLCCRHDAGTRARRGKCADRGSLLGGRSAWTAWNLDRQRVFPSISALQLLNIAMQRIPMFDESSEIKSVCLHGVNFIAGNEDLFFLSVMSEAAMTWELFWIVVLDP
ncbi:hypothetical protein [Microvirga sesbaniae]|uniref:hypothetical protein n=1 Tax=Microvirga sesbaniae TaxID=681392 RepID=UPI0021CADFEB|nr:hypothetical protein [Microvirga sp. HBU67692]